MNRIHPTATLASGVKLGSGNVIGPNVIITDGTTIGCNNWIGANCILGALPEHRSVAHDSEWMNRRSSDSPGLTLGDDNIIREFTAIQPGLQRATRIGSHCFIMTRAYIAHDCWIDDDVTLAAGVFLAGHTEVGFGANLGVGASTHQFVNVGIGAMIGMGAVVLKNTPSFALSVGIPARTIGANRVGLERAGIPAGTIDALETVIMDDDADSSSSDIARLESEFITLRRRAMA